jgi:hypothetical protein
MIPFIYRCPVTGSRVQGWTPKETAHAYVAVDCLACGCMHIVDPKAEKSSDGAAETVQQTEPSNPKA